MTLPPRSRIPDPLLTREQWIIWANEDIEDRDEKTKVPYQTTGRHADTTDPDTWSSFDKARKAADMIPGMNGVAYVFTAASPIVGVDLDKCVDNGELDTWAEWVVAALDSYTHISTSGTGLHVFALGSVPDGGNRKGNIEMYDQDRFFAFTGDHLEGTPTGLEQRNDEIRAVWDAHINVDDDEDEYDDTGGENDGGSSEVHDVSMDAQEIIDKAKEAEYKKNTFGRLFERGDISSYPSQSEADSALCCLLAWWTGHDDKLMDEIFRKSALMRPKWDEDRGGDTYGEITIEAAKKKTTGSYDPNHGDDGDEDEEPDVDPAAFERESTTSLRVLSAAMKAVEADDINVDLDNAHIEQVGDDEWMDVESGKTFDTLSLVAWLEGLTETPTENVEGRAAWIELGSALRFRGATVPRYDHTGGVSGSTTPAGWG